MTDRRDCGRGLVMRIGEHRAFIQQALQASAEFLAEAAEIVVAHLVDHDGQHQSRAFIGAEDSRCRQQAGGQQQGTVIGRTHEQGSSAARQ